MDDQDTLDLTAPIARSSDPSSSFEAADEVTESGSRESQAKQCLALVRDHPGRTSRELAELSGVDRYVLARRLADLRRAEKVANHREGEWWQSPNREQRKCEVTGRKALVWWAVELWES